MNTIINLFEIARWMIAIPLLIISLYFTLTNFRFLLENFRLGLNAGPAPMTIVGGLAGCLGLLILPYMEFADRLAFIWVPLILDLGSLPFYISLLVLTLSRVLGMRLFKNHRDYQAGRNT